MNGNKERPPLEKALDHLTSLEDLAVPEFVLQGSPSWLVAMDVGHLRRSLKAAIESEDVGS